MNEKRKIKELEAQDTYNIIRTLKGFRKNWKPFTLNGSGCFINITTLGGGAAFESFIDGKSFDDNILPALEKAILETLERKRNYLSFQISEIDDTLNKK